MPGGHEVSEEIEHAVHANKGIALLIAVLALFLAFASAGGKWAQTAAISENVEAANLWTFYQAKAIRASTLLTAAAGDLDPEDGDFGDPALSRAHAAWALRAGRAVVESEWPELAHKLPSAKTQD